MITDPERAYIAERAYLPEHLPHYVTAISRTEPFLLGDFVAHLAGTHLVFVGYPLTGGFEAGKMLDELEQAQGRFEASRVSLLAPPLPHPPPGLLPLPSGPVLPPRPVPPAPPKKDAQHAGARAQGSDGRDRDVWTGA